VSFHNTPKYQIPELIEALKNHGLRHDKPNQLADAFRIGWMAGQAAIAAAQAVQASPGWQPIETAPKDGSWIVALGCYPHSGAPETVRWLEDEWGDGGGDGYSLRDPTHWMPLPPLSDLTNQKET